MKIYINNKEYQLTDLESFIRRNSKYSKLIKFIQNWRIGKQTFNFHTSGSTGKPKEISITKNQITSSVLATKKALDLNQNDKVLICLNPEYIATTMMVARCLVLDLDMHIIEPSANPFELLNDKVKIDFASFVPLQVETILNNKKANMLEGIRNILIGGAPLSANLINQLSAINTNTYQSYGMTETVSHIALMNLKTDDCFNTIEGIEIQQDSRQCLSIKGAVTNDIWVQSNDVVELINSSKFRWLGRADNIINSGGVKIFPETLEALAIDILKQNNFHNSFFFYGQKSEKFGEIVGLIFEKCKPEKTILDSLNNSIIKRFSKYHIPKIISTVNGLSRTESGKIKRIETVESLN
jgi:O-succinylbenzoic acid--CoA ligase